jgi:hypothetical protein
MQRKSGIDNMGIGLLAMLIIFAIFALTLGVSALLFMLVYWLLGNYLPLALQVLGGAVIATLVISLEGWGAFKWASGLLWRYDPSEKTVGVRKSR